MKNNILKIILVSLTIFSTFFTFGTTTYASSSSYFMYKIYNESNFVVYSDTLVWRYKTVNNNLYKRLYNETKQEWIGDWILIT